MTVAADTAVHIDGPWAHRSVSANGTRFHIAESGDGPLVLLLHGFPQFWWAWRHQLFSLPPAGFRAVAADLRGYGGSDKPPRGYDLVTAAADVAGLIRALGEANAIVVGHDWGGMVLDRRLVFPRGRAAPGRGIGGASAAHAGRHARRAGEPRPRGGGGYALAFQLPIMPERQLLHDGAQRVGRMLADWSAPGWPTRRPS